MRIDLPKVSIIVPVYNREKQIDYCLKSISLQDYQNYEVLIIDDGSKDNTAQICKDSEKKDKRFRYYFRIIRALVLREIKGLRKHKVNGLPVWIQMMPFFPSIFL